MTIFELLYQLKDLFIKDDQIKISNKEILIFSNNKNYLKINNSSIELLGLNIFEKLKVNNNYNSNLNWDKFSDFFKFIKTINDNIQKLNHLGFGYKINNIEEELEKYQQILPSDFQIYEEVSDDIENNRWFFIKHKTNKLIPKIELVLYQTDKYKSYFPQFQIDIDTNLTFDVLKKYLGSNFFFWNLNIPNYGIVMGMGKIGVINGINILVGIGTNLRKKQKLDRLLL